MSSVDHSLQKEIDAARVLREQLRAIAGDDADVMRDTLDGETSIRELIGAACELIAADDGLADGLRAAIENLKARADRIARRQDMRREAILSAMQTVGFRSLETATGTLTVKSLAPRLVITDESKVPSEFWKARDPELDRRSVLAALKDKRAVEGAQLSNGGETLQIRR